MGGRELLWRSLKSIGNTLTPATMTSSTSNGTVHEGVFAINKPTGITSAQVIRDVQTHFNPSHLFKPWFAQEQAKKDAETHNQRKKRNNWKARQQLQVKIGHGGTLDPLATGVLILGVGNGTKSLNQFLACTKSYETVLLFGAATDSYDTEGKIVARKPYAHVTREMVEEKLAQFRGKIMQRPPIFSAKRIQGKRLYEYAREGLPLPEGYKIEECALEVQELEMTEWMEGGSHAYQWPEAEAAKAEKDVAAKVLHLEREASVDDAERDKVAVDTTSGAKRKRAEEAETVNGVATEPTGAPSPKRTKSPPPPPNPEPVASGAIPVATATTSTDTTFASTSGVEEVPPEQQHMPTTTEQPQPAAAAKSPCPAPAVRLRMTVTSGFYVRSLCHDLGAAVGSLGIMAALVRTRQGDFELGVNTLWYEDLALGEGVWAPKVEGMLERWNAGEKRMAAKGREGGAEEEGRREEEEDGGVAGVGSARALAEDGGAEDTAAAAEVVERRSGQAKPAARARVRRNTSSEED
ncbi:hypothetical protein LTR36_001961 [Oleoguttula mirabilis]|uniref:tRNA pseudouridine(55) synthase n=1 Tax=Oleoguttula mirabilis TaxID=1507867 RepID=A0AAV9JM05_9PEZI|nr:hypothetical protein LTR36_001961 [Oleoguttula mirabilis]